jgi:hypothetical protein
MLLTRQARAQETLQRSSYSFKASRKGSIREFREGTRLRIKYRESNTLKRFYGIYRRSFSKEQLTLQKIRGTDSVTIPLTDILSVSKPHRKYRIIALSGGTLLLAGSTALLVDYANSPVTAMRAALVIPIAGVGVYLLLSAPVSFLIDKLNVMNKANGWEFHLSR